MRMGQGGYSAAELLIATAILSVVVLLAARFLKGTTQFSTSETGRLLMQSDAESIFIHLSGPLEMAGSGVQNQNNMGSGYGSSIIAEPQSLDNPEIIFLSTAPSGILDSSTQWTRYWLNPGGRVEMDTYKAASWTCVPTIPARPQCSGSTLSPSASPVVLPLSPGVNISSMSFTLYSSGNYDSNNNNMPEPLPPTHSYAASYVKITLYMVAGSVPMQQEHWVVLRNLVFGRAD